MACMWLHVFIPQMRRGGHRQSASSGIVSPDPHRQSDTSGPDPHVSRRLEKPGSSAQVGGAGVEGGEEVASSLVQVRRGGGG